MSSKHASAIRLAARPHPSPSENGGQDGAEEARAVVDAEGRIAFASPEFCKIFGSSPSDLSGQLFDRFFRIGWPDLAAFGAGEGGGEGVRRLSRRDAATGEGLFHMDWMSGADGRRFLVIAPVEAGPEARSLPSLPPLAPQDAPLLERTRRQLSEAESIGHMGHWRWAVGTQGVEWSDGMYRIFGLTRTEFTPTLDSVNALLHRRDAGRLVQVFQRAIIEKNDYDLDFRVMRPDGEARHVRCEGRCEKDAEGEVVALYGIMQDVTERMQHEKQLRDARDAAERAYAAKSQFLATMSHELRTPLNAIIGFSEIMQKQILGPIGTPRYLEYIEGIRQSGAHLLDLIGDILDMSRIEAGKYTLDIEPLDLGSVLDLCMRMMAGKAQEAGVSLAIEPPPQGTSVRADRRALTQIVLNLLSNAVKFTPGGGNVVLSCAGEENGFVAIRVSDTGCGIPAGKLRTVTRPFEQAHDNLYERKKEGSGLGLAITRELTELHGGTLRIESEVGAGTRVTVRLPVKGGK